MMKNKKGNVSAFSNSKGITLIALIITIIVMLILVAVTVRTAINSGLFGHAKDAASKWEKAQKDEQFEGIGDYIEEQVNDGSYILAFCWNDNVRKYFDRDNIYNAFYIVRDRDGSTQFRNYLNLNISTEFDEAYENALKWEVFNENAKTGFLCDEKGQPVYGWYTDSEFTEEMRKDVAKPLNIEYEIEGKERIGTEINSTGEIFAKFSDGSKRLICQIVITAFSASNTLTKVETNLYAENYGSGEFDGIGMDISAKNGIMKRISKTTSNKIEEENAKIRETKYTLTINDNSKDYCFVTNDGTQNIFVKGQIDLYQGEGWNAEIGKATEKGGPLTEEQLWGCTGDICDENGNVLMGYQVDSESGEIKYETPSRLRIGSQSNMILEAEATTKAKLMGNINDNTKTLEFILYDRLGYEYKAIFNVAGTNGNYTLKLNKLQYIDYEENIATEEVKNKCVYNLTYNTSTGKVNQDSFEIDLTSLEDSFEKITVNTEQSKYDKNSNTAKLEKGDINGEGKGHIGGQILKAYINEEGKFYGIYDNGMEKLLGQIALSTSDTGELVTENFPKIEISKP